MKCRQKNWNQSRSQFAVIRHQVAPSQVPTKLKRTFNHFRSWNFCFAIQTDLLGEQDSASVSIDAKKILLSEHLRTRLGHKKPPAVVSITASVFCNFTFGLVSPQGTSPLIFVPLISVSIVGYVQSESRIVHAMTGITGWFLDATWSPVLCCLADHPDFSLYMSLVENTAGPWRKLSVIGELGFL